MNAEIKCVVLDDEPRAIDVLEHYVNLTRGLKVTGRFRNAIEAFEFIKSNEVDLLFLDVEMPLVQKQFLHPPIDIMRLMALICKRSITCLSHFHTIGSLKQ